VNSALNWLRGRQLEVDVKLGHTQAKAGMRPADGYFNSLLSNEEMLRLGVLGRPDPEMLDADGTGTDAHRQRQFLLADFACRNKACMTTAIDQ
jgi:hypothetical protein